MANNKLGKTHFWLHNLSLPLFMVGLGFLIYGNESLLLLVIVGSNVLAISVIVFVVNVFKNLKVDAS
ncbi:hypothetical protein [Pontibacillus sp. HMF3514]|uniref:hypothetical protein n=1 Tax=Pontibacillus sp. HMF3514 TaxID=2692425 RepID=UPI001F377824|nr:hypothetical protein [Pontibacillus sp. HMF3514]